MIFSKVEFFSQTAGWECLGLLISQLMYLLDEIRNFCLFAV